MSEDKQNTESVASETATESGAEAPESGAEAPTKKESITQRVKRMRQEKKSARASYVLDVVCLVLIIVFAKFFKPSHYIGQTTSLLYYYEDATVLSNEEVENTETGEHRWEVRISYKIGNEDKTKYLYYKRNPKYKNGDVIRLKIQTVNPDNIEIEGKVK